MRHQYTYDTRGNVLTTIFKSTVGSWKSVTEQRDLEVQYRTLDDGTWQSKNIYYNQDGSVREEEDWE